MRTDTFLPRSQTKAKVGMSSSQIDRLEKVGKFPRRIQISERRVVWSEAELEEWMRARKAKRDANNHDSVPDANDRFHGSRGQVHTALEVDIG